MKNQDLPNKLKELRITKGYSQDQLSELSNVSVRTIQRIENGKTIPSGDTLSRLAKALDAAVDGLFLNDKKVDKGFISLIALSSIAYIIHPFLGILIPTILWYKKKDSILDVDEIGRKIISFQITWQLLLFSYMVFVLSTTALAYYNYGISGFAKLIGRYGIKSPYGEILMTIYLVNLFVTLVNLVVIQLGHKPRYMLSIPFMYWKS